MTWLQNYDPLNSAFLSTTVAALPVVVLLGTIAILHVRIHYAAVLGLLVALGVALFAYRMPLPAVLGTTLYGSLYGLFPIGWIILNLIFLYQLTVEKGLFAVLRGSLASLAPDPRIQVILIAFSFGAFFEGAAGFGTPVAVTAAILIQLGFRPLQASGLSLIANTAPVAFGALGTPIIALSGVTGIDMKILSAMVGRQLPIFSLIVPFWVVWAFAGFRGMVQVWPAALAAGASFAIPQYLISNFHGPWLVDIVAAMSSMAGMAVLLKFWQPKERWKLPENADAEAELGVAGARDTGAAPNAPKQEKAASSELVVAPSVSSDDAGRKHSREQVVRAWVPWVILSVLLFVWGVPQVKNFMNGDTPVQTPKGQVLKHAGPTKLDVPIPGIDKVVVRTFPVVPKPTAEKPTPPEKAVFTLNWLSATGSCILVSALIGGLVMGFSFGGMFKTYWQTLVKVRFSLLTIAAMLALGYVTKYSGSDATLGLSMAKTGSWYPFFGTLLGWLGVALTGSDTASNVLFGSLQTITAKQTGISPILMAAANSSGGVMGKMVDAQSIVVASTATNWYGHEDKILRYVFFHSIALAALVGIWVSLQAYVAPFSAMVVK
jgi:lactate permease